MTEEKIKKEYLLKFGNGDFMIGYHDVELLKETIERSLQNRQNNYDLSKYVLNMDNLFVDEFVNGTVIERKYTTNLKFIKQLDDNVVCCNDTDELFEKLYQEIEYLEDKQTSQEIQKLIEKYKSYASYEEMSM